MLMTTKEQVSPRKKCRVFVVDDHPIVRQGLALMINREPDMLVCGEAEESNSALQAVPALEPDILIVDISLSGPDGIDLVKTVRASDSRLPILVLSMHDEAIYAERALRAGANGYIMKQEATDKVLIAVRRILSGDVYLSDRMSGKMLQQYVQGASVTHSPLSSLSDRELEVFRLIGEGHGTRQIAEDLHLSVKTVETYQAHLKEKLAIRNSRQLMHHAMEWHRTGKIN
jgi:DNA-binding NarL/FixJ family response regulator